MVAPAHCLIRMLLWGHHVWKVYSQWDVRTGQIPWTNSWVQQRWRAWSFSAKSWRFQRYQLFPNIQYPTTWLCELGVRVTQGSLILSTSACLSDISKPVVLEQRRKQLQTLHAPPLGGLWRLSLRPAWQVKIQIGARYLFFVLYWI